jgi:hypothetical protein
MMETDRSRVLERLGVVEHVLLWAAAAALLWAVTDWILRAAPVTLSRPTTVLANAHPAIRSISGYLAFLGELKAALPSGATVEVLSERKDSECLIAIGQLTTQRVIWPCDTRQGFLSAKPGDYVASFESPLATTAAKLVARTNSGFLYRLAR